MITKQDILQYRNRSYQRDLDDRIFRASQSQNALDERTTTEAIQHYGLIIKVGDDHYISFANPDIAQVVLSSLQQQHADHLAPTSRQSPLFNQHDESFRINVTSDYFDYLAHMDGTDPRAVLRIKTPGESKNIIRACIKRLDLDKDVDIYNNREELVRDMLEHGMFAVVDDTKASIFVPDDRLGKKIYNGLWMYAPELLEDQNYGNGQTKFGNSISRESAPRSLQEIHLSLAATQDFLSHSRVSSRKIVNGGNSIGGDKQSTADALVSHFSLVEGGTELPADNVAISNFIKPASEREGSSISPKETVRPHEVHQYIEVLRPNGSNVIDAAHLFGRDKRFAPGAGTQTPEVEELFHAHHPTVAAPQHRQADDVPIVPPLSQPVTVPEHTHEAAPILPVLAPVLAAAVVPVVASVTPPAEEKIDAPVENIPPPIIVPPLPPQVELDTPAHELNGRHRKKPKEVLMPTTSAAIADNDPYAAYEGYKRSFGFQIKMRRDERDMTLQDVAVAITGSLSGGSSISPDQVRKWEQARELPNDDQAKALAIALIDENETITDKEQARRAFMQAYERSKGAFDRQERSDDRFAFADMLSEHRESFRNRRKMTLSLEGLAAKASEHVKISITEEEEGRLRSEPREFIAAIEAGAIIPSRGLTVALVAALDKKKTLSGEEKSALYAALEQSSESIATPVVHRINGSARPTSVIEAEETPAAPPQPRQELGEEIKAIKRKLHAFFQGEDAPSLNQVAIDAGFPRGSSNLVYVLMSDDNSQNPRKIGALSDTVKTRLATYLSTHGKNVQEVERFKQAFDEMRQVTGYTARQAQPTQSGASLV